MRLACAAVVALIGVMPALAADAQLSPGFEHFYNLEYPQAISYFRTEIAREPDNPEAWVHLAQALLYSEMFHAGALESELVSGSNPFIRREKMEPSAEVAKEFDKCVTKTLSLGEARLAANARDVGAKYVMGVAYGLRANYNYLVRKAWMEALKDAGSSRRMHNEVTQAVPNDMDSRLVQGLYDYLVGSLPWHIRALGFIAGYRGDREAGLRTLKQVAEQGQRNLYDARIVLAAIYRRERRPLDALPLLRGLSVRFPRNYLLRLEMVQMYSDAGQKQPAVNILDQLESEKKSGSQAVAGLPSEKILYYRGNLLFWYREYDAAIECLKRVTPNAAVLDLHTAVMTWMRLGQCYDMKRDRKSAEYAYRQAVRLGPQTDVAKESRSYLNSPYKRPANA